MIDEEDMFERSFFVNCPFDKDYAPLLEAALFCIVFFGFTPRLADERLEAGENRLEKIVELIKCCKYSFHDLSRCRASKKGEYMRMNMPFEYGIDVGFRRSDNEQLKSKKFLIFESNAYELKRALSDIAGQDVCSHNQNFETVIKHVREFFQVEVGVNAPGVARLKGHYEDFQGWMVAKKIFEGHSEDEAVNLPTRERLDEMQRWVQLGMPTEFV